MQGRKPEDGTLKRKVSEETAANRTGNWNGTFSNAKDQEKTRATHKIGKFDLFLSFSGCRPKCYQHACDSLREPVCLSHRH